jgi:hypothetical protein
MKTLPFVMALGGLTLALGCNPVVQTKDVPPETSDMAGGGTAAAGGGSGASVGGGTAAGGGTTIDADAGMTGGGTPTGGGTATGTENLGENCQNPDDLVAKSVALTQQTYANRLSGVLGGSNDYNPSMASDDPKPPACDAINSAPGNDVVYRVQLPAGALLDMRLTLEPSISAQPTLYVLTSCTPMPVIEDTDGNGFCGSRESNTGLCTSALCNPARLQYKNNTSQARDVWVVVDQGKGFLFPTVTPVTSFELEWTIL